MQPARADGERLELACRRSRRTLLGHVIFLAVVCAAAAFLRRSFRLPPIILATVVIAALLVFAGDILRFFSSENELRRFRAAGKKS